MKTIAWEYTSFFWIRGDKAELYDIIYVDLVGGISTVQFQTFDNTIKGDVEGKLQ